MCARGSTRRGRKQERVVGLGVARLTFRHCVGVKGGGVEFAATRERGVVYCVSARAKVGGGGKEKQRERREEKQLRNGEKATWSARARAREKDGHGENDGEWEASMS